MSIVVDISYWQGFITAATFAAWKANGVERIIAKAGGAESGRFVKDSRHDANVAAARQVGLGIDHYFFNGNLDPAQSADQLVAFAQPQTGDRFWFDIENTTGVTHWNPGQALIALQRLRDAHGVLGGVYMSSSVTKSQDWSAVVAFGAPLWVAQYGSNNGTVQGAPSIAYWSTFTYWQFTSVGHEPGYNGNLDLNTIGGTAVVGVSAPVSASVGYNASTWSTRQIQQALIRLGYNLGPAGADDKYGSYTTAAVHKFEVDHGLAVDVGIAGPQVVGALARLISAPAPVVSSKLAVDGNYQTLTCKAEQRALGITPDGVRGVHTIEAEQRRTGAHVDGVDGPDTTRHLQSYLIARGYGAIVGSPDGNRGTRTIKGLQTALNDGKF